MTQRPDKQARPETAARVGSTPVAQPAAPDAAAADLLQRTIGNRAVGALHGGPPVQPPAHAQAGIAAIVQRHPIVNGVHTPHKPKDKAHSDAEENQALKTAQETWLAIEASLQNDVLPKNSRETSALLPGVLTAYNTIKLQFDITQASVSKKHVAAIRQLFQKIEGRKGAIETRVLDQTSAEERSVASTASQAAPGLLNRVEANASSAAECAKRAVGAGSPAVAGKELELAQRDLSVAEEQTQRIDSILVRVAKYADLVAFVRVHKAAADAAMNSLRASVQAIKGMIDAQQKVDDAQETLDSTRADAALLAAAEEVVRDVEAYLLQEEELSRVFYNDLAQVAERTQFSGGVSVQDLRNQRAAVVEKVRQTLADAREDLQNVRDAVARVPAEEHDLDQAKLNAAAAKAGVVAAADTEITRIDQQQELRELAGGEEVLAELKATIADGAKLKGLLEAIGVSRLKGWLKNPEIGGVKATALYDALGKDKLKTFIYDVGPGWCDTLVGTMSVTEMVDLADDTKLGSKKLGELILSFGFLSLAKLINAITLAKVKTLSEQFTKAEFAKTKLSVDDLIDLHTKFTAIQLKHWFTTFGDESIHDFLTKYTAATLDTFITAVGEARFEVLVRDKRLKANALHHYGAAFLKDFVGVNGASMAHLNNAVIIYNTDGNGNRVSGGHDPAAFNAALNQIIRPALAPVMNGAIVVTPGRPAVRAGRSFNAAPLGTECTKVDYELHNYDGAILGGGQKTLINTLAGQQAVWQARGNEAIWNSIRILNCDTGTRRWSGASAGGFAFAGFLSMDLKSVATFYPA